MILALNTSFTVIFLLLHINQLEGAELARREKRDASRQETCFSSAESQDLERMGIDLRFLCALLGLGSNRAAEKQHSTSRSATMQIEQPFPMWRWSVEASDTAVTKKL